MTQEETNTWRPVVRKSRQIPFGYKANPADNTTLLPEEEELNALIDSQILDLSQCMTALDDISKTRSFS